MAWLLHEPRLRSEVPIFCIIAIKPIIFNSASPISVATGSVQLLNHLHSRLEILIDEELPQEDKQTREIGSSPVRPKTHTPILWESCWLPILSAMSEGVYSSRLPVSAMSFQFLCSAIVDKHAEVVPVCVMTKILQDLVIPACKHAGNNLLPLAVVSKSTTTTPTDEQLNLGYTKLVTKCLSSISESFIEMLPKLAENPKVFVILWLEIIGLFGFYLGAPTGINYMEYRVSKGDNGDGKYASVDPDATENVIATASSELRGMIAVAKQTNLFAWLKGTHSDRLGEDLLLSTKQLCGAFSLAPSTLIDEVLNGSTE